MDKGKFIIILIFLLIILVFLKVSKKEVEYIKSDIDGKSYLVRDVKDKQQAANMLARIRSNLLLLNKHTLENIDKYSEFAQYINRVNVRVNDVVINESSEDSVYTSYSVNKGEQIVFCLRSKRSRTKIHDLNLMMYVAIHELAHIASPEYGHTDLFKKIFAFYTNTAIEIGVYKHIDFKNNPTEYCGLTISESIV